MTKVMGAGRLLLTALGTAVVTLVAILVIGPWGWTAGVDVSHGPPLTGPMPSPSVDPNVIYRSPDGSVVVRGQQYGPDRTDRFDVAALARGDHSVVITEDITQTFGTERHGIERSIPLHDDAGDHAMRSLEVSTDADTPGQVALIEGAGFDGLTVRIGDPDRTVAGTHRYRLTYVLENVVSEPQPTEPLGVTRFASPSGPPPTTAPMPPAGATQRVALDAFTDWQQPVYGSSYTLTGPDGRTDHACYQEVGSYTVGCAGITPTADGATFDATVPMAPSTVFTVQVDWPEGTFGPAVVHGPERSSWPIRLTAVGLSLLGVVVVAFEALGRRRTLWARTRKGVIATFGDGSDDGRTSGLVPRSPWVDAPVEFVPPMGLRPAELLRLGDGARAEPSRLLAATVIDLAASGHLELAAATADADWVARRRVVAGGRDLRPFEERLLSALFPEGVDEVRFGERAQEIGPSRDRILEQLDDDLKQAGLLRRRLGTSPSGCVAGVARAGSTFVVAVVLLGVVLALGLKAVLAWAPAMLIAGATVGVSVALWGLWRVRRAGGDLTTKGLGAVFRAEGFQRFFNESESMHARAAADEGLLRQYLGYAVAFDAVDRWVAAFDAPDLTWLGTSDIAVFTGFVYGSAMAQAATPPAPVSSGSGSGGFSGFGGGFGGGGGGGSGGGGGGSW